jgi:hypothetical protein
MNNGKLGVTIIQLAIIRAANQARKRLEHPSSNPEKVRRATHMLHIGQELWRRLEAEGVDLPEVDLTDPPSATAAPANVHSRQAAVSYAAHEDSGW